jgi:hypothetical protein
MVDRLGGRLTTGCGSPRLSDIGGVTKVSGYRRHRKERQQGLQSKGCLILLDSRPLNRPEYTAIFRMIQDHAGGRGFGCCAKSVTLAVGHVIEWDDSGSENGAEGSDRPNI